MHERPRAPLILSVALAGIATIASALPAPAWPALRELAPNLPALALTPATVRAAGPDFPDYDSGYHSFPEMVAEIQQAELDHPAIVDVFSIGTSHQGREIWAAKVSDGVAGDEDEPEVLIDALHHAREHFTVEQALYLFSVLTDEYGTDETVTRLVDSREIWFVFALNPDGFEYDLTGSPYRAWRKNRQPNAGTTAVGTDLNRNYDYRWGCCGGSSGSKSSITYRGPKAFSAPETRAIRDFVASRRVNGRQQIRTHVTLHTNGRLILWPYGYTVTNRPTDMSQDDYAAFVGLGRAMADRNGYRAMQSSDLYITDGDQIDWMYGRQRIFSFTFELYPPETASVWRDHYPPDEKIATETARNRSALLYLIDRADCPWAPLGSTKVRQNCGPFFDDAEITRGWQVDPDGTDTATSGTRGAWQRGDPQATSSQGPKQLGSVTSGRAGFVTGLLAGSAASARDLDGVTTLRSQPIPLPADPAASGSLTFRYAVGHRSNANIGDGLDVYVEDAAGVRTRVLEVRGRRIDLDATWKTGRASVAAWAGQSVRLVFVGSDIGRDSLIELALDDIRIERPA